MKILFAADGSKYTKKALAFLVNHEDLAGAEGEVAVLNLQAPVLAQSSLFKSPGTPRRR
jgi:hypothetical protein